jgi:hypothetical protein
MKLKRIFCEAEVFSDLRIKKLRGAITHEHGTPIMETGTAMDLVGGTMIEVCTDLYATTIQPWQTTLAYILHRSTQYTDQRNFWANGEGNCAFYITCVTYLP